MEVFIGACREYGRSQQSLGAVVDALITMQRHRSQLVAALRSEEQWCMEETVTSSTSSGARSKPLYLSSPLGVLSYFQSPVAVEEDMPSPTTTTTTTEDLSCSKASSSRGHRAASSTMSRRKTVVRKVSLPVVEGQLAALEEDVSALVSQYSNLAHSLQEVPRRIGLHCTQPVQDALLQEDPSFSRSSVSADTTSLDTLLSVSKARVPYDPVLLLTMMEGVQGRLSEHAALVDASVLPIRTALAEALGGNDAASATASVVALDGSALNEVRVAVLRPMSRAQFQRKVAAAPAGTSSNNQQSNLDTAPTGLLPVLEALSAGIRDDSVVMPNRQGGVLGNDSDELLKLFLL